MNRSTFYSLEDEFKFGKYQGLTLHEVIESYPGYLVWCLENLSHLQMSSDLIEDIRDNYPHFAGNDLLNQHELYDSDYYEDEEEYYGRNYDRYDDYYEEEHYEEYAGTYVQDVMGWSDEMIEDVLDGDPDAYWNID